MQKKQNVNNDATKDSSIDRDTNIPSAGGNGTVAQKQKNTRQIYKLFSCFLSTQQPLECLKAFIK